MTSGIPSQEPMNNWTTADKLRDGQTVANHAGSAFPWQPNSPFKLKVMSKILASGKCQVKFYATLSGLKRIYGYTLVDASTTLKEVVNSIHEKLTERQNADQFYHSHLYSLRKQEDEFSNFMIFEV